MRIVQETVRSHNLIIEVKLQSLLQYDITVNLNNATLTSGCGF